MKYWYSGQDVGRTKFRKCNRCWGIQVDHILPDLKPTLVYSGCTSAELDFSSGFCQAKNTASISCFLENSITGYPHKIQNCCFCTQIRNDSPTLSRPFPDPLPTLYMYRHCQENVVIKRVQCVVPWIKFKGRWVLEKIRAYRARNPPPSE